MLVFDAPQLLSLFFEIVTKVDSIELVVTPTKHNASVMRTVAKNKKEREEREEEREKKDRRKSEEKKE